MLTSSDTLFELISSTFASDLYGLIRRILHLNFVRPYCKFTVPLVNHCFIKNGPYMEFNICMQRGY